MGDEVNLLEQDCAYSPPWKDPYHGKGGIDAVRQKRRLQLAQPTPSARRPLPRDRLAFNLGSFRVSQSLNRGDPSPGFAPVSGTPLGPSSLVSPAPWRSAALEAQERPPRGHPSSRRRRSPWRVPRQEPRRRWKVSSAVGWTGRRWPTQDDVPQARSATRTGIRSRAGIPPLA